MGASAFVVFTSRSYTPLVKSYDLQQEFITPYTPVQNGIPTELIRAWLPGEGPCLQIRGRQSPESC